MADDHYQVLGVPRTATAEDIRKAYREMARKYHPDLHPDDKAAQEQFKKVQTAFDVLNDPSKREMYDRYGSSFDFGGGGGRGKRAGRGRRAAAMPGEDLSATITVPFKLAIDGGKTEVRIERDGRGETISVTIPQGLPDGGRMRLRGQGRPGSGGGPAGDLLLLVRVEPHPVFRRDGDTLRVGLPITLSEAIAGAKVDLPTPWGTISLRIPPGTSAGKKLRAAGMGVRHANGAKGDLIADVQIALPGGADAATTEALLEAARAAEATATEPPRAGLVW